MVTPTRYRVEFLSLGTQSVTKYSGQKVLRTPIVARRARTIWVVGKRCTPLPPRRFPLVAQLLSVIAAHRQLDAYRMDFKVYPYGAS